MKWINREISLKYRSGAMALCALLLVLVTLMGFSAFAQDRVVADPSEIPLAVEEVDEAVKRFTSRAVEFQGEISNVVDMYYNYKKSQIDRRYEKTLRKYEAREMALILSAIEQLELFISRYPNTPQYTPDAMFRLAELYYQKSKIEFDKVRDAKLKEYEKQLAMFDEGLLDTEPNPPAPDNAKPVELYTTISNRFPNYRYIDSVYYLLAYAYQEENNLPGVRQAFEDLIATNPESKYVAEAYLRIGDAYFNEFKYEPALESLIKAAEFKDSDYYDQVLYKLASTYFILDRFQEAIATFGELNDYSEIKFKKEGKHSFFREESIRYIAFCYAQGENYWPGAGVNNAIAYFDQLGDKPWEPQVFRDLGDYFVQQTKWQDAVAAFHRVLEKDPWNPDNPTLQEKVIRIYVFGLRDESQQHLERQKLATNYGETSQWARHNADNPEALRNAQDLVQGSLKQWAFFQHAQAQKFREMGDEGQARLFYNRAADAYRNFIAQFPHDKDAYEIGFSLAESMFFSGNYKVAVEEYLKIRDSKLSDKYFQESAYMVVMCYDNMVGASGGDLTQTEAQAQAQQRERLKGKVEELPIPKLKQAYIDAGNFYVENTSKPLDQEKIAWNSAEILFEYNHLIDARLRYVEIVNKFPKSEYAVKAAKRIIDTYYVSQNWVKVTEWSEKLASLAIGSTEGRDKMRAALKEVKGNAMAQYAKELEERDENEKAAEQYLKAVEQEPKSKQAPLMLYNAAANYMRAKRPAKAMNLFQRMVDDYPQSEYAADALGLVAANAYDSFNLDKAKVAYAKLYTNYPTIKPKDKCQAIYNHGQLLEFNHEYGQAAGVFEKYANECAGIVDDAPIVLFRAAEIYERLEDNQSMLRLYKNFIDRFGQKTENHRFVVQAYFKIGQMHDKRGRPQEAVRYYKRAIDFFQTHPNISTDFLANKLAAEAAFTLNEKEYEKYAELKISGRNQKAMKKSFEKKEQLMNDMIRMYEPIKQYKNPEYFLAASYRMAEAVELFADSLFDAPIPKEVEKGGEEYVLAYQQALADQARPFYQQALAAYMQTFDAGKKSKLFASIWMKKLMNALNRPNIKNLMTETVQMRKPEKARFRMDISSPMPMDNGKKKEKKTAPEKKAPDPKAGQANAGTTTG